jgi:uncharacterized protein (TIGR00288 family)
MNEKTGTSSMAVFCDFENVALGVRDARYAAFDIRKVLERLLLKGNIVVKKAYCDWERFKEFKKAMHEAAFELIEIPHVRMSGKNSADIRMVVDALDLCYTKSHVDMFVVISGDSDFSPLVSKLRENNKMVIGVGVKNSSSDLLISGCDEFIYYDDLVREHERNRDPEAKRRRTRRRTEKDEKPAGPAAKERNDAAKPAGTEEPSREEEQPGAQPKGEDVRRQEGLDHVMATVESLFQERGPEDKVWASMVKQALKRLKPGFNERYHGFRSFANMLEELQARGLVELEPDEKSGSYIIRAINP